MAKHTNTDNSLLAMALVGYEAAKAKDQRSHRGDSGEVGEIIGCSHPVCSEETHDECCWTQAHCRCTTKAVGGIEEESGAGQERREACGAAPKKRKMSAAARKRIGDAARKRWAAQRKAGGKKAKLVAKAAPKAAATS